MSILCCVIFFFHANFNKSIKNKTKWEKPEPIKPTHQINPSSAQSPAILPPHRDQTIQFTASQFNRDKGTENPPKILFQERELTPRLLDLHLLSLPSINPSFS
jgi:hypothetical protein